MRLTSRCFCYSYAIFTVILFVCVCFAISRQRTGSPGQGQDGLQRPVCHDPGWEDQEENQDHLWKPQPRLGGKVQLVS